MKETKRALRRHHRQRMIARTLRLSYLWNLEEQDRLQKVLRLYNNRKICDCCLCTNPRKCLGPTIQERRQSYERRSDFDYAVLSAED